MEKLWNGYVVCDRIFLLIINNDNAMSNESLLHDAIESENIQAIKALVKNGTDIHCINDLASTPLEHAVQVGNIEIIKILLKAGASVYFGVGSTPLNDAIKTERIDLITTLFDDGEVNLSIDPENSLNLLVEAILSRNLNIVKLLVEKEANINGSRPDGKSALMCAAIWGGLEIFNYLLPISSPEIREKVAKEIADNLIVPEFINNKSIKEISF